MSLLDGLFGKGKKKEAETEPEPPPPQQSGTAAFAKPKEDSPIDYTIEIQDLPERGGLEIVVSIVNHGEEPVAIHGAKLAYSVDFKDKGIHSLSFPAADRQGRLVLDQFEIAQGHHFVKKYTDYQNIRTKVFVEYEYHDRIAQECVSQRLQTRQYKKQTDEDASAG